MAITSTTSRTNIAKTQLRWENNTPISTQFNDIYFSTKSGIAETQHTFLKHNQLAQRFAQLKAGETFIIGETGFGTGLNFLCAWDLFLQHASTQTKLTFISTEKYPLHRDDLQRALQPFDTLAHLTEAWLPHYAIKGDTIQFCSADQRIELRVYLGDVLDTLATVPDTIDAWFLDGFAPAKNPDMWQPKLFEQIKLKSHDHTTYATFTAARIVRDGMESAGFSTEKQTGFGKKREILCGRKRTGSAMMSQTPWFQPPIDGNRQPQLQDKHTVVIGGGLSGCSTAYALAKRGWQVTLLEQHDALAHEASGNPQGVLYTKLSADNTPLSRLILNGYHYTLTQLEALQLQEWQQCGVIQLAIDEKTAQRYQALDAIHPDSLLSYLNAEQLSEHAGLTLDYAGLYFPEGGWVHPPALCRALTNHPNITIHTDVTVTELARQSDEWLINAANERQWISKTVISAQAAHCKTIPQLKHLQVKSIRGQITEVQATAASSALKSCVCGEGYIAPAVNSAHTTGATFGFKDNDPSVREEDHQQNLAMQAKYFNAMYQAMGAKDAKVLGGKTGFRCTTPDYLPVIGPVVDSSAFIDTFAALLKNSKAIIAKQPPYLAGLYVNTGHGSRGIITCPLAGELLAAMINNEAPMLPEVLMNAVHPSRFLVRDLMRNKI